MVGSSNSSLTGGYPTAPASSRLSVRGSRAPGRAERPDYLTQQSDETGGVAGRRRRIAHPRNHQALQRRDDDSLAEIAESEERGARHAALDSRFGPGVVAPIGPKASAVLGVERERPRTRPSPRAKNAAVARYAAAETWKRSGRPFGSV